MSYLAYILTALSQGVGVSQVGAWSLEVLRGATPNKLWIFLIQWMFFASAISFFYIIFPDISWTLNIIYYTSILFMIVLSYVASILHENLGKKNAGDEADVQRLPYDLHKQAWFERLVLNFHSYLAPMMMMFYGVTLILAICYGYYLYVGLQLLMIAADQLYQHRFFPNVLAFPYLMFTQILGAMTFTGFSNTFFTTLSFLSAGFLVWDYICTHFLGVTSASSQFQMASPEKTLTLEDLPEELKPSSKIRVASLLNTMKALDGKTRVTFNHFRMPWLIKQRSPHEKNHDSDFQRYQKLFDQINLDTPEFEALLLNELTEHGRFNEQSLVSRQTERLGSPHEIRKSFLRDEIGRMVQRLNHPINQALPHQVIDGLLNQAYVLLDHLEKMPDSSKKQGILLTLAIRTGGHCWRMYLETFSELFNQEVAKALPLTLEEEAAVAAQSLREEAFKKYYYVAFPRFKLLNPVYFLSDKHDYHTYESFTMSFGAYFYLQNDALSSQMRGIFDVLSDYYNTYFITRIIGRFSDYYQEKHFIDAIVKPSGVLHQVFKRWCETRLYQESEYCSAFTDFTLTEDLFPIDQNSQEGENLRALARLMLLDLGLIASDDVERLNAVRKEARYPEEPSWIYTQTCRFFQPCVQAIEDATQDMSRETELLMRSMTGLMLKV